MRAATIASLAVLVSCTSAPLSEGESLSVSDASVAASEDLATSETPKPTEAPSPTPVPVEEPTEVPTPPPPPTAIPTATPEPRSIATEIAAAVQSRTEPTSWQEQRLNYQTFFADMIGPIGSEIGPLPMWLDPGTWRTNALGTDVALNLVQPLALLNETPGLLLLDAAPGNPDAPRLWLGRPSSSIDDGAGDYGRSSQSDRVGPDTTMPEDILDWLQTLDLVATEEMQAEMIGGNEAGRYRIAAVGELPATCALGNGQCIDLMATSGTLDSPKLPGGHLGEIWEIEQPGTDIVVLATALEADADDWFEAVAELLRASEFGEPQPPPFSEYFQAIQGILDPGTYRFRMFPELEFTFQEPVQMGGGNFEFLVRPDRRNNYGFIIRRVDFDADLVPIESSGQAVAAIERDAGDHIASSSGSTLAGFDAVSFEIRRPWNNPFPLFYSGPILDRPATELYPFSIRSSHNQQIVELDSGVWILDLGWPNESEEEGALAFYESIEIRAVSDEPDS